jgi:tRNA threonylcarbamoyladenosine biosynthesis protein TsaB
MKILAVETATSWHSVALLDEERVLAHEDGDGTGNQAALLLPAIDRLLAHTGLRLSDLQGLACSAGPGSFTGIRVGVATCLGLRAATDLPLVLVPTLEAMAWNVPAATVPLCPVLISRKDEVYWAIFRWIDGRLERLLAEHVGAPRALAQSLTESAMLFGDGWLSIEADIRAALAPAVGPVAAPSSAAKPSAIAVGRLGLEKLRKGEVAGLGVAPLYVQRAQAELTYEQSGGLSPVARRQERAKRKTADRLARGRRTPGRANESNESNESKESDGM